MTISNRTILITGGASGIGLAIAKALSPLNNQLILVGRNPEKLKKAALELPNTHIFSVDITNGENLNELVNEIENRFPKLDVLINNAGTAHAYHISEDEDDYEKASLEINTNYLAIINITQKFLPLLRNQPQAAIINVSSVVSIIPSAVVPTYSASKAALHSYTQLLRHELEKNSAVKVFELMPPLVNTEFSRNIGGEHGISPDQVAKELIDGLEKDQYEIHVDRTSKLFKLFLNSPEQAFTAMNTKSR